MTRRDFHHVVAFSLGSAATAPVVTFDEPRRTFTIDNGVIRKQVRVDAGRLRLEYLGLRSGRNWAAPASRWGADVYTKAGDSVSFGPNLPYARHEILPGELRLYFGAPGGLELVLHTRVFEGLAVLEQWVEIRNGGTAVVSIERFDPLLVPVAIGTAETPWLHYVQGCQDYGYGRGIGTSLQPFGPFRVRRVRLDSDDSRTLINTAANYANARRSTSASENLNWFSIETAQGGIFGGLQWSGEWALTFARTGPELVVHGGVNNFIRTLAPGETLVSPRAIIGFHRPSGVDRGIHELHRYLRAHVMPPRPDANFPWACYNTWYNWSIDLREDALKREADAAARLGLECFYLDAGWWAGSIAKGGFGKALGAWTENREKFPSGVKSFGDYVHGLGMKFGLWVEPERIDHALVGQGPDALSESWLAGRDDAALARNDGTHQLCFGSPDAVAWIGRKLTYLISAYGVDWLKWDHNFYMPCNRTGHGHQAGDGGFAHIQGVYSVLQLLRERFPNLVIENCAGGGNRFDFGMMRYTQTNWTSDDTAPSYRVRYHSLGCSHPFPAQYQNSWYIRAGRKGGETVSADSSPEYLDYLFRSRMIGAFGISDRVAEWPPNVFEAARRAIAAYKRMRPILNGGDVYHVLPQPLLWTPPLAPPRQWEAIEYFDPKQHRGVILAFRADAPEAATRIPVRGVDPARRYAIQSENTSTVQTRTGAEWLKDGFLLALNARNTSEVLWISPARRGSA
jgi:alpha-galactosidase